MFEKKKQIRVYIRKNKNTNSECVCDGILLGHKERNNPFAATWMDLEMIILISKRSHKDKYHISLICGI